MAKSDVVRLSVEMSVKHGPVTLLSAVETDRWKKLNCSWRKANLFLGPILESGNTKSRYRFSIGARKFVNDWNAQGPAHHCAVGVCRIADKIEKLGGAAGRRKLPEFVERRSTAFNPGSPNETRPIATRNKLKLELQPLFGGGGVFGTQNDFAAFPTGAADVVKPAQAGSARRCRKTDSASAKTKSCPRRCPSPSRLPFGCFPANHSN